MSGEGAVVGDLDVARDETGHLVVSWSLQGEADRLDVALGSSPEGVDHEHALHVDASAGRVVLEPSLLAGRRAGGRLYVSVSPSGGGGATIAAERSVGLRGPVNFRDLGGYRSADGSRVRWGMVFRADALRLSDSDLDAFAGLGIRTVYDLRGDTEREANPNRLPEGRRPDVQAVPLVSEDPDSNPLESMDTTSGESFLEQLYVHILERSARNFGRVLTGLADDTRLPAVFHCAAGKDRTGMVAAVLLSILGVGRDVVLDDYELTGKYRTNEHVTASLRRLEEDRLLAPEVATGILSTPRWAMESALAHTERTYGGFDGYLTGPAGARADVPDRLRALLLRP